MADESPIANTDSGGEAAAVVVQTASAALTEYDERVTASLVHNRTGSVLSEDSILKGDKYPTVWKKELVPRLSGAPNFRKVDSLPIYGCAQPSIQGVRNVVQLVRSRSVTRRPMCWVNVREEILIVINDRVFVIRDVYAPDTTASKYLGISSERLATLEDRLKADVLCEIDRFGGFLLVHDEVEEGVVVPMWEHVLPENVCTLAEAFAKLGSELDVPMAYHRIPFHPEQPAGDVSAVGQLVSVISANPDAVLVFNCHSGRGRSTHAMAVATLVARHWQAHGLVPAAGPGAEDDDAVYRPQTFSVAVMEDRHREGNYKIILDLMRLLDDATAAKEAVDVAIDACAHIQNIRESVWFYHQLSQKRTTADARLRSETDARASLDRYFFLICLQSYLASVDGADLTDVPFGEWMASRDEIRLLHRRALEQKKTLFFGDGVVRALSREVIERSGHILSARSALRLEAIKRADKAASDICPDLIDIEGVPNLHFVHHLTIEEMTTLLVWLHCGHTPDAPPDACAYICNLDPAPMVYINGVPYSLCEAENPIHQIDYAGISNATLTAMESGLKVDVFREAAEAGQVLVHYASETEAATAGIQEPGDTMGFDHRYEHVDNSSLETPSELFHNFTADGFSVKYFRAPLSSNSIATTAFDVLQDCLLTSLSSPNHSIVFTAAARERSKVALAMVVSLLVVNREKAVAAKPSQKGMFPQIRQLVRTLPNGEASKARVDAALDAVGDISNFRDRIMAYKLKNDSLVASTPHDPRVFGEVSYAIGRAVHNLRLYFLCVAFAEFTSEQAASLGEVSFSDWFAAKPELKLFYDLISENPHEAVDDAFAEEYVPPASISQEDHAAVLRDRSGPVLHANAIVKSDHFPGCHKDHLPVMEGAPNFRHATTTAPVYGVGNPTTEGIRHVIEAVGADKTIVWTNLREEPVVFVNGRPYVLRTLAHPFRNMKATGIATEAVEAMERRLRDDLRADAAKYGGHLLLHGENDDFSMKAYWENVNDPNAIQTPREVYDAFVAEGVNIEFSRIPVTDEEVMEEGDFDDVRAIVESHRADDGTLPPDLVFVYNCQMGRGRTTTGMVTATMTLTAADFLAKHSPGGSATTAAVGAGASTSSTAGQPSESSAKGSGGGGEGDGRLLAPPPTSKVVKGMSVDSFGLFGARAVNAEDVYARGDYRIITDLVKVLPRGRQARRLADTAIDKCDHIQNLRSTVWVYHEKSMLQPQNHAKALDFLLRYVYLVIFASYTIWMESEEGPAITFSKWVDARPEIRSCLTGLALV